MIPQNQSPDAGQLPIRGHGNGSTPGSHADKLAKLKTKKADLLTQREQLQNEAAQKGVAPDEIKGANLNWRRAHALEDLKKGFKASVDAQDRLNLASAIKRLKNFDDLDVALGGKENAQKLI